MIPDTTLAEIERLMAEATPGPWAVDPDVRPGCEWNNHIVSPRGRVCFMAHNPHNNDALDKAAHLIARLRNEAPMLIEENKSLKRLAVDVMASLAAAISLLEKGGERGAPSRKMFDIMLADYKASLERARAALNQEAGS